ncbi:hypothetical protein E3J62_08040 [candidate division TA06 bacterium]|uniref:Uncharacterized protein n=1 Tax=candidate division TA06 bacterium TaxID=2250710 RepID=A0A523URX6_UNCT6|nr:MAG: hypothetical protein E3J62_08040 [candidate division TA06 bacterium]
MKKLEVSFDQKQVGAFGYVTSLNAYVDFVGDDLFDALESRKEQYGGFLDGVCGDAFRFFYSREDRMGSAFVYPHNPLRVIAGSLAYKHEYTYDDEEDSIVRIKKYIEDGKPVLMPLVLPPPEWALVIGYDDVRFYLHTFTGPRQMTREQFTEASGKPWWQPTLDKEKPSGSNPMFILIERMVRADLQKIIIDALKLGIELTTTQEIEYDGKRYIGGVAALQERANDLAEDRDYANLEDKTLISWHFFPFLYYQLSRWSRASFLNIAARHFTGADREKIESAMHQTEKISKLTRAYRETLSVPWPKSPPDSQEILLTKIKENERRKKGIRLLRQMADAEKATVEELQKLVG